jgi:hypothetical protein
MFLKNNPAKQEEVEETVRRYDRVQELMDEIRYLRDAYASCCCAVLCCSVSLLVFALCDEETSP